MKLAYDLSGEKFLDFFDFESGMDPNGGASVYVTEAQATAQKLVSVQGNAVVLNVDRTKKVSQRKSIKLVSKKVFK